MSTSPVTHVRGVAGALLRSEAVARALVAAYFALTVALSLTQHFLQDEGVFTLDMARFARHAPIAIFFFEKAKPVLMLIYAVPAMLGPAAFGVVHALLGALAVHLVIGAARALGSSVPNVAGWALACAQGFTIAASNGYPNSDGAFFVAMFLFLYASERRGAAALVLGVSPFVRSELAAVTLVFLGWDLLTRRDARFAVTALVLPLLYALGGAIYHRDLLWLYNEFPDPSGLPSAIRVHRTPSPLEALVNLRDALATNAPLLLSLGLVAIGRGQKRALPLALAAFAVYVGMTALQVADVLGFDTSPRYYVAALPLLAVLSAVALSEPDGSRRELATWIAGVALALGCATASTPVAIGAAAGVAALVLSRFERDAAIALVVLASVCLLTWQLGDEDVRERTQRRGLHALLDEMRARGLYDGEPLFTDFVIARDDRQVPSREVWLLANDAIVWEMRTYSNDANEQERAILDAMEQSRVLVDPERFEVRRDAVYTLRDHERTRRWRERLEREGATGTLIGQNWVYRCCGP